MSSHDMMNPDGGVNMGQIMESPDPNALPGYGPVNSVNRPVLRLPAFGGDPHAGWWGGRGRKSPGYPIMPILLLCALQGSRLFHHALG